MGCLWVFTVSTDEASEGVYGSLLLVHDVAGQRVYGSSLICSLWR